MKRKISRPPIPKSTQLKLWLLAGGRCEFPGCNIPLWRDKLTLLETNYSQIGHIIAAKPDGPRGHPEMSSKLSKNFENLMLLCPIHHKLIDSKEHEENYSVEYLTIAKKEHEKRIFTVTEIKSGWNTNICLFRGLIGAQRPSFITNEQVMAAIKPRYPISDHPIDIDLTTISVPEGVDSFYFSKKLVTDKVSTLIKNNPSLNTCNHFSIFGLAPIPLLIYFGFQFGDTLPCDIYQFHRETSSWNWATAETFIGSLTEKKPTFRVGNEVVLKLEISGEIPAEMIAPHFSKKLPEYEISAKVPSLTWLRNPNQISEFRNLFLATLAHIRSAFGMKCRVNLFPAIPAPIAIEFGRCLLTKVEPNLGIFDFNRDRKEYYLAMEM